MALFVFTALLSITVGQVCVLYYAVGYGDLIPQSSAERLVSVVEEPHHKHSGERRRRYR